MALAIDHSDILALSVEERIELAQVIWDSIAAVPQTLPLTDAQQHELDRRLAAPAEGIPWDAVKTQALARAASCG